MASLTTSQFIFHDDTIDILVGNRVVNNVQLTNSRILALHRIGKFDVPQVFTVYVNSEEPGLHSILFRLSTIKDVATLVPLMRIDITSIISNCPGLTMLQLFPDQTRILLYLREEHICIHFSPTCIIYANLRLSHRVDTGGVYRFVLPSTASCMLSIPNAEHITSMDANEYLYACVGNALLRTKIPINLHILSKRQAPMAFKRIATLATPGEYVCLNRSILSDSTLSEIDYHRSGYKHATTLLDKPIDIVPLSQKPSQQLQRVYPPLPSDLANHHCQKKVPATVHFFI
ncbi:Putative Zn-dependent peptidase [Giardia duodenalis]|uniref:Putative Zn-dependent peptidase n=1 Tax=Giardia intestinalis TaxID=5741 RepID=V6TQ53_GIAIN|nr:Putative Zn-dependent peptidase [Giardia intestinalis]